MSDKNSQKEGTLYLVATPIGNLGDLSPRALEVLASASLIAAEDTRHTRKLLAAKDVQAEMLSYREQNHARVKARIIERLRSGGDVALVSDAGTPGISDPGQSLVAAALDSGLRVCPLPGPCAAIAALAASGLDSDRFIFLGFPPRKAGAFDALTEGLEREPGTLIFYESPQRVGKALDRLAQRWPERQAVVARELSKIHEEFDRGCLRELAPRWSGEARGEFVLLVEGAGQEAAEERLAPELERLEPLVQALRSAEAQSAKGAARLLSDCLGLDRRELYRLASRGGGRQGRGED